MSTATLSTQPIPQTSVMSAPNAPRPTATSSSADPSRTSVGSGRGSTRGCGVSNSATASQSSGTIKKKKKVTKGKKSVTLNMSACNSGTEVLKRATALLHWKGTLNPDLSKPDFLWFDTGAHDRFLAQLSKLQPHQSVNKFPGMADIVGKVNMAHLFERYVRLFGSEFETFYPRTWISPRDDDEIYAYVKKHAGKRTVIIKPDRGSQGDGIHLVRTPNDFRTGHVNPSEAVVQRYLEKPLLLDGYKFDFRVYALLVSVDPVEIYLCREGLARFCTERYEEPNSSNVRKAYMHLTNYSLNKLNADNYVHDTTAISEDGTKRRLSTVFDELRTSSDTDLDVDKIWDDVRAMVTKTALAISVPLGANYHNSVNEPQERPSKCFQILGYDVMLDKWGNPWLLEVNGNPSLRIDFEAEVAGKPGVHELLPSPIDEAIKIPMVSEALRIIRRRKLHARRKAENGSSSGSDSSEHDSDDEDGGEAALLSAPRGSEEEDREVPLFEKCDTEPYEHMQVLEDCRRVFAHFSGVRKKTEMSRSKFVAFARGAGLVTKEMSAATFDLMYIAVLRHARPASDAASTSMGVMEFCDALSRIAAMLYPDMSPPDGLQTLLERVRNDSGMS